MKEKEFFEEKIIQGAETLIDIKEIHRADLKDLGAIFSAGFGRKPKDFQILAKNIFYKDGIPKETSKAKTTTVLDNFIQLATWYNYIGKGEEINRILNNHGIEISFIDNEVSATQKVDTGKFKQLWGDYFNGEEAPEDKVAALNKLLDNACTTLSSIETLKKEIDEDMGFDVETKCEVDTKVFKKTAQLKASLMEGKDITDKVASIEHSADQLSSALEILG